MAVAVAVAGVTLIAGSLVAANRGAVGPTASGPPSPSSAAHADRRDGGGPFAFLAEHRGGDPVRWDPCRPIHYEVNLGHAPAGALRVVEQAVARVAEATGVTFVFDRETPRTAAHTQDHLFRDEHFELYPVLVSWAPPEEFRRYGNPERYAAIGLPFQGQDADRGWYRSGMIVVNTGAHAHASFVYRGDLGPLLLHEWGHVMGLAHVRDRDQIMWSRDMASADRDPDPFLVEYGEGDLAGLRAVGAEAGCELAA